MAPVGAVGVAAPGRVGAGGVNVMEALQAPSPAAFQVWIHHVCVPVPRVSPDGVIEQVPVPLLQPAWLAVYHCLKIFPEGPFTHK